MTPEKQTLLIIRGTIAEQSAEDRAKVKAAEDEIRAVLTKYPGGHGMMAVALLGAEMAVEQ